MVSYRASLEPDMYFSLFPLLASHFFPFKFKNNGGEIAQTHFQFPRTYEGS